MLRGLRVRVIDSTEAFERMAPAWQSLATRCARPSPFLTHEWLDAAWQWRSESADLAVLACEHGSDLVGLLPLARPHDRGGNAGRTLEYLTIPDTQCCDLLTARGFERQVAIAFASHLARLSSEWDVIRLPGLRTNSIAREMLVPALESFGASRIEAPRNTEAWIALGGRWEDFYRRRSRRLKKANSLAGNRLSRAGRVNLRWIAPKSGSSSDIARIAATLTSVSAASWKRVTGYSLDRRGPQAFLQRLLQHAHARGWLSVWILELDRRAIATELQLVHRGNVYGLRADFDHAYARLSPGSHLLHRLLEGMFDRGYERYLMGPGDNPYKFRWCNGADSVHASLLYSPTVRGRTLATWESRLLPAARRLLWPSRQETEPSTGKAQQGKLS